jgi:hypothetical protein
MTPVDDFGACCCCGLTRREGANVRNVTQLHLKAPIAGTGWGCVVCKLPPDGAIAVFCDTCIKGFGYQGTSQVVQPEHHGVCRIRMVCFGYVTERTRMPISKLAVVSFDHSPECHPHGEWKVSVPEHFIDRREPEGTRP